MRRERSASKEEVEGERTVRGVRVSLSIVIRRPRCVVSETRDWNAVCSSWEAEIPDCILFSSSFLCGFLCRCGENEEDKRSRLITDIWCFG